MPSPIVRDSLIDLLTDRLKDDILTGRYPPGSYLPPERDLALDYAVTRTSLKHALTRLAQVGLVETRHGVGTVVRDYLSLGGAELLPFLVRGHDGDWLAEIFQVRRDIGALVAARAATHASPADHARLQVQLAKLKGAPTPDEVQLADCAIHRTLAAAGGNRVYGLLVNSLLNAYLPVRALLVAPFLDAEEAAQRIAPVIDAVRAGDPERAHEAATAYLDETERLMLGSPS